MHMTDKHNGVTRVNGRTGLPVPFHPRGTENRKGTRGPPVNQKEKHDEYENAAALLRSRTGDVQKIGYDEVEGDGNDEDEDEDTGGPPKRRKVRFQAADEDDEVPEFAVTLGATRRSGHLIKREKMMRCIDGFARDIFDNSWDYSFVSDRKRDLSWVYGICCVYGRNQYFVERKHAIIIIGMKIQLDC